MVLRMSSDAHPGSCVIRLPHGRPSAARATHACVTKNPSTQSDSTQFCQPPAVVMPTHAAWLLACSSALSV